MLSTIKETAQNLGVSSEFVRRMVQAGKWPAYRLSAKAIRLDLEEIKALTKIGERKHEPNITHKPRHKSVEAPKTGVKA